MTGQRDPNPFKSAVPNSQAQPPLDVGLLNQTLGEAETGAILKLFVVSSQDLLDQINQSIAQRNSVLLKEATHTLKGACSSIGANQMFRRCIEIEKANNPADWITLTQLAAILQAEFEQISQFIAGLS